MISPPQCLERDTGPVHGTVFGPESSRERGRGCRGQQKRQRDLLLNLCSRFFATRRFCEQWRLSLVESFCESARQAARTINLRSRGREKIGRETPNIGAVGGRYAPELSADAPRLGRQDLSPADGCKPRNAGRGFDSSALGRQG
jgi:hypothetical protein